MVKPIVIRRKDGSSRTVLKTQKSHMIERYQSLRDQTDLLTYDRGWHDAGKGGAQLLGNGAIDFYAIISVLETGMPLGNLDIRSL